MEDILLLKKKVIKLKDIEKFAYIEEHRAFGIFWNRTYDFTIKFFDATLKHMSLVTFLLFISLAVAAPN